MVKSKKKKASGLGMGIQNRVVITYCFRGQPWIRLEINQKKRWVVVFLYRGEIKKNASGLGTGIQNRVVISYCFRGRPWIRLEINKKKMRRGVFIQGEIKKK